MDALECLYQSVVATAPRVVASGHPAATAAGLAAYARGGNAFDAALAACFMETVALPMKCGLGGDLIALFRRAGGSFETLISVGGGALALSRGATLERVGPRSVGVPGAPDGYSALHGFAALSLEALTAPAIHASEAGVPWTRSALSYLDEAEPLLQRFSPSHPYRTEGLRPAEGDIRRLPGLGQLLGAFAELGANLFRGKHGEELATALRARGGILEREDFERCCVQRSEAQLVSLDDDTRLYVTPAPTAGPRLADVVRRAWRRPRALVSVVRQERIDFRRYGRLAEDGDTSVVTAADDDGNAVVVVHSNSFPRFGSGVVLDSGLVLNNRPGRGFDLEAPAGSRNAPAAGRVPATTLHAWALERGDRTWMGATPGGVNQLPWNAQTVADLLGGAPLHQAVTRPRWALDEQDVLSAEDGVTLDEGSGEVRRLKRFAHRSAQQVLALQSVTRPSAAADPRTGAAAFGHY